MIKLTFRQPYSDEVLTWNDDFNHYELTIAYVKEHCVMTFANDEVLRMRIEKNSRIVYNYIYGKTATNNNVVVSYALNKTEEGRKFLRDVLLTQMEADLMSGYNSLTNTPAVNVANGQVLDRNELRKNKVSVETEDLIDNNYTYFGINLLTPYTFPTYLLRIAYEGTK